MTPTSFSDVTQMNAILNSNNEYKQNTYFKRQVHSSMLASLLRATFMSSLLSAEWLETLICVRCLYSVSRKLGSAAESYLAGYTGEAEQHNECTVCLAAPSNQPHHQRAPLFSRGHSNVCGSGKQICPVLSEQSLIFQEIIIMTI